MCKMLRRSKQIPSVADDIQEYRDATVGLHPWRRQELNASGPHPLERSAEVIDPQEKTDPAGDLAANRGCVAFPIGTSEQDARVSIGRPDHNPPLRAPIVCQGRGVLNQFEAQHVDEELDSRVVILDHNGDERDVHGDRIRPEVVG